MSSAAASLLFFSSVSFAKEQSLQSWQRSLSLEEIWRFWEVWTSGGSAALLRWALSGLQGCSLQRRAWCFCSWWGLCTDYLRCFIRQCWIWGRIQLLVNLGNSLSVLQTASAWLFVCIGAFWGKGGVKPLFPWTHQGKELEWVSPCVCRVVRMCQWFHMACPAVVAVCEPWSHSLYLARGYGFCRWM